MKAYLEQSERPLAAILLVTPLAAVYELGTRGAFDSWLGTTTTLRAEQLVAFDLLRRGFGQLGATASVLPAGLLVACLLGWHLARRDGWSVRPTVLAGMAIEATLLAVPIALLGVAISRAFPLAAGPSHDRVLLSIGAGLYEELLFRLLGFVVLHVLLADILRFPKWLALGGTVALSASAFSLYHCLGSEAFQWPAFVFRSVAGVVLGVIFLSRGFGITALSHVAYNLLLCAAASRNAV